jgi:TPR repeat protein
MSTLARVALLSLLFVGFARIHAAESDEINSLRIKAEHGNALAQYNLGLAYAQGRQVAADPAEAFAWLSLASESGATGKALDSLLGNITDAQLAEGRRRFTTYRAAVIAQSVEAKVHSAPKLAPRGFSLESRQSTTPGPKSATAVTKAPEAVAAPLSTSPAEGADAAELAQARRDLEKAQVDLVSANNELAALKEDQARLEAAASDAKAREAKLTAELQAAQRELAALRPVPSPAPAPKP